MTSARVLVVGSGGREHALAARLALDAGAPNVLLAPGNEGAGREFRRLDLGESDGRALIEAARREKVTLVVIGPEAPLARGVADDLSAAGISVFGASRAAARLESSKWFAKEILAEARVPSARAERLERPVDALDALRRFDPPWVLKADGLASGKGVCVTSDRAAAERFLRACFEEHRFGAGGETVVIEEFLRGDEVSWMVVTDGVDHVALPAARDYKRAGDQDRGSNTGGMGAFAPVELDPSLAREIDERIVAPVLSAMRGRGAPFRGLLYVGLMLTAAGPRVLEFNARFGDPETQVVLPLLGGSLIDLLSSAARGSIDRHAITKESGAAVAVALVDEGYPDAVRGGGRIEGLDRLAAEGVHVIHAATAWREGAWTVAGGRAAYVVARAEDRERARERAYRAITGLSGSGWRCRHDIAGATGIEPGIGAPRSAAGCA
ncbi:MAG TPA: phosphoribosylamine--glycine ligase [Candidatus Udaeobacter sp.]|jgi:phosphoribosylamine--glycine ligase|nr:phosphoribosylamine--glycine ligase [Candidatus Udaeobacter sp.]